MLLDLTTLLPILVVIALGAYVQTVIGFAFGLINMGVLSSLNLLPITTAAILVTFLTLTNSVFALMGNHNNIYWRAVTVCLVTSLPAIGGGLYLLSFLDENALSTLRLLLGLTILTCGLVILKPPREGKKESSLLTYGFFGVFAGLLGGMFSTNGPPVVFQFYRQPLSLVVIRDSLLAIFLFNTLTRTIIVASSGQMKMSVVLVTLIALPVVIAFTALGRRFPPKISEKILRRGVFSLLALSAAGLILN